MSEFEPNKLETMFALMARLADYLRKRNPDAALLDTFQEFDELIAMYQNMREGMTTSEINNALGPLAPIVEATIESLKEGIGECELTDECNELKAIEEELSSADNLTEERINTLLDRRRELLDSIGKEGETDNR